METKEFCEKMKIPYISDGGVVWYRAKDLGRLLKLRKIRTSLISIPEVDRQVMSSMTNGGSQKTLMLTMSGVKRLLCHSRSLNASILAKGFGIDILSNRSVPNETETLSFLRKIFVGVHMIPQFQCGEYRIDMYVPSCKVAIECDEKESHRPSKALADVEREQWIKKELGCSFIRFEPDEPGFDIARVAGEVFQKIMESKLV